MASRDLRSLLLDRNSLQSNKTKLYLWIDKMYLTKYSILQEKTWSPPLGFIIINKSM